MVLAVVALANRDGQAHKPITSPYTYNEDVFPIVRERCGQCHVPGGVAPMSLMTYKDAYPWGESIRTELIAGHMPPWGIESGHANIKNARTLTAKELNILLTWATGGNPIGNTERTLEPVGLSRDWRLGTPDLVLPAPTELGLAADVAETTAEFTLKTGTTEAKWVRAVDLLPGNPAIVRSATVAIKGAPTTETAQHTRTGASARNVATGRDGRLARSRWGIPASCRRRARRPSALQEDVAIRACRDDRPQHRWCLLRLSAGVRGSCTDARAGRRRR